MSKKRPEPQLVFKTEQVLRASVVEPEVCERAVASGITSQISENMPVDESDIKHCPICKTVYKSPILFYCSYETARLVDGPVLTTGAPISNSAPKPMKTRGRRIHRTRITAVFCLSLAITYFVQPWLISGSLEDIPRDVDLQQGRYLLDVVAPLPYLRRGKPAKQFEALRQLIITGAGFDFLAKCGDMLRTENFKSSKPGVAYLSRHKSGDAFDYNQEDSHVLLVREQKDGRTYWRTYLICERQDGTQGVKTILNTDNVGKVSAYVFDFTAAAEDLGWERIPAMEGWDREPSKKEYCHYEMPDVLSFDQALKLVNSKLLKIAGRTSEAR